LWGRFEVLTEVASGRLLRTFRRNLLPEYPSALEAEAAGYSYSTRLQGIISQKTEAPHIYLAFHQKKLYFTLQIYEDKKLYNKNIANLHAVLGRVSSVGIVMTLQAGQLENLGLIPEGGKDFCLRHSV
jgi:hypothetical protein